MKVEKLFLFICLFFVVTFLFMSASVYSVRIENNKLLNQLISLENEVRSNNNFQDERSSQLMSMIFYLGRESEREQEKLNIVEEALQYKDTKWVKIKSVRDIVRQHMKVNLNINDVTSIAGSVVDYSEEYDVPIPLILGVMKRESAFNPRATSRAGAIGLMQVLPSTGKDIASEIGRNRYNLFKAKDNIQFGVWYLRKLMDIFDNNVELAVRSYNCGPTYVTNVRAGIYKDYPEETKEYIQYVLKYKEDFEGSGL